MVLDFKTSKTAIQILSGLICVCVFGLFVSCGLSIGQDASKTDGSKRGFLRRTFVDDTGAEHQYVIFLPHGYQPGSRPPVLMLLNGVGENGDDGIRQISKNCGDPVWESREFFPFLAIATQCRTDGSWAIGSLDTRWAMQILDTAIRDFKADEDRIYLTGVSAGESAVWDFASAFPDKFAAVIPLCGSGGGDPDRLAESRIPIWNIYNEKDLKGLVEFNRSIRKQLIDRGVSPIFTEHPHERHDCWNQGYRTTALYEWLLLQRRSDNRQAASFTSISASHALSTWEQSRGGVWSTNESCDLIGRGLDENPLEPESPLYNRHVISNGTDRIAIATSNYVMVACSSISATSIVDFAAYGPATGVGFRNSFVKFSDVTDGTSNTFLVGERCFPFGALNAGSANALGFSTQVNTSGASAGIKATGMCVLGIPNHGINWTSDKRIHQGRAFHSLHLGGAHFLLCDGSVHFVIENIQYNRVTYADPNYTNGAWDDSPSSTSVPVTMDKSLEIHENTKHKDGEVHMFVTRIAKLP